MFKNDRDSEDSNFWISYADLMAGLLFVFILLIGAIVSKSSILKRDLHKQEDRLSELSRSLKSKEEALNDLSDTLAKNRALLGEKDQFLSQNAKIIAENKRLLALRDARIAEEKKKFKKSQKDLADKNRRISKNEDKLTKNERLLKLKMDEIKKLNLMLLDAKNRENLLSKKVLVVQTLLDRDKDKIKEKEKSIKEFEGKVLLLSNALNNSKDAEKIKEEKLLTILNAMNEKKSKYDKLLSSLQAQKSKIKSLTGIKLKVVAALKRALGNKIDIDKKTGSLRLASNILFGVGESTLKDAAKVELKKAFEEYIGTLVTDKEIKPHLDKIIIEGHTDSDGEYIYNLKLSQDRALAVMEYLLTLDFSKKNNIQSLMMASGRAYLDPVLKNGIEDKEASRRIEIKFRLRNDDAMHEIEKVLDAQ